MLTFLVALKILNSTILCVVSPIDTEVIGVTPRVPRHVNAWLLLSVEGLILFFFLVSWPKEDYRYNVACPCSAFDSSSQGLSHPLIHPQMEFCGLQLVTDVKGETLILFPAYGT